MSTSSEKGPAAGREATTSDIKGRPGTSKESAQRQHERWLGADQQTPGEPYQPDRVSTPKQEDQPEVD